MIQLVKCMFNLRMYLACRCVSLVHELSLFALVCASKSFCLEIGSTPCDYKIKNISCNITEKLNKSFWKSAQESNARSERKGFIGY